MLYFLGFSQLKRNVIASCLVINLIILLQYVNLKQLFERMFSYQILIYGQFAGFFV